jgi:hypothetical protein
MRRSLVSLITFTMLQLPGCTRHNRYSDGGGIKSSNTTVTQGWQRNDALAATGRRSAGNVVGWDSDRT